MANKKRLLDNFLRYVKIDTGAISNAGKIPSSPGQLELAKMVAEDLKAAGVKDIKVTEQAYLLATIPENLPANHPAKGKVPTLGFVSHFDTSEEAPNSGVKPRVVENYNGKVITYPNNPAIRLDPSELEELRKCVGNTIITSDGTTLLGADDKAGIAEIVEMANYFKEHPEVPHGKIRIGIIPDEEIVVGASHLDLKEFGADKAYTIDAKSPGMLDVESFNGHKGTIKVHGNVTYPGLGKGIYLNAWVVLSKFVAAMPDKYWPQNGEGRQPIWWVENFNGGTNLAELTVYLRGFDLSDIEMLKGELNNVKDRVLKEYPKAKIEIDISETYKNYKCALDKDKRVVEYAMEAMKRIGLEPRPVSLRGGNDSGHFCFKGLISTNVFCGFEEMHSLREWVSLEAMEKSVDTIISLVNVWLEKSAKG